MIIIFVTLGNLLDLSAPLLLYLYRMETVLMMHLAIECQNYFLKHHTNANFHTCLHSIQQTVQ